jgi:signal transduction histidine kinase
MQRGLERLLELKEEACDIALADAGASAAQEIALSSWVPEVLAAIAPLHAHRAVRLEVALEAPPPLVLPEPLLRKAVIGLVRNAIEATADGGWVQVATAERAGAVVLEVADGGVGLDETARKQLFHGFVHAGETRDYTSGRAYDFGAGGRGLDLLRTRHFADRQGFSIEVESEPGEGSRFRLVFPAALLRSAAADTAAAAVVASQPAGQLEHLPLPSPGAAAPAAALPEAAQGDFFRELSIPLLAHELKGPLAVIEAGIRTLIGRSTGSESDARSDRTLRRVLRGARRAQGLVDDLLEVGRAEAGLVDRDSFRPVEVVLESVRGAVEAMDAELADRVASSSGEELVAGLRDGGVDLSIGELASAVVVEQDARRVGLVVANLVRNALRFRKSRVELRLDVAEASGTGVEGKVLRVAVEDDGPGVAAEDRERIFERWASGAAAASGPRQGHGLGLAAARILARGMGGEVALEGERGSRFVLTVPLRPAARGRE